MSFLLLNNIGPLRELYMNGGQNTKLDERTQIYVVCNLSGTCVGLGPKPNKVSSKTNHPFYLFINFIFKKFPRNFSKFTVIKKHRVQVFWSDESTESIKFLQCLKYEYLFHTRIFGVEINR